MANKKSPTNLLELSDFAFVSKEKYNPASGVDLPCIELEHIEKEIGILNGRTQSLLQASIKNRFDAGDVLFGKLRPNLRKFAQPSFSGVCSTEIWVLKTDAKKCARDFLFYLVQSGKFIQTACKTTGSKMPRADWELVSQEPFHLPSLAEQGKIAAILRTWDNAIEKIGSIIKLKETKKAALAQRLLTGKVRRPPTTWKTVKLRTVATEIKTRNQDGFLGLDKVMGVNKVHGLIPMREETIGASLERYKTVPPEAFAYNPMRINIGSLAMSEKTETVLVSPDYVVFSCNDGQLDPYYFNQYRRSHIWEKYMEAAGNGSVRIRIYYNDLADMKILLPSYEEQKVIAAVLNEADLELKKLSDLLDTYKSQKRGLMQKLLTGEWRVNVSGDMEAA
ncbi:MAG: restriction endonuclease subunit S [Alphaproteobacteria bacterium]|nr:restriction endonuclease subunit S [Alphaproteobacteria bacterium]